MALRELLLPWLTQPAETAPLSAEVIGGATFQGFVAGRGAVGGYVPTVATAAAAVNRLGQARTLTGSGGYLSAPAVAGNTPWTLLFYGVLRSAGASSIATYAELPGDTSYDRSLFITSGGAVAGYVYDGALKTAFAGAPAAGVPFLAAVVGTTSSLTAYLDGVPGTAVATSNAGYSAYSTPELVIGYGGGSGGGNGGSAGLASLVDLAYLLRIDRALSAQQLRALGVAPWLVFEDQRILVPRAAGAGGTGPVGLATETDAALALAALQVRAVGVATEADTALSLAPLQIRAVGLSTETDTALARSAVQSKPAGLAAETDSALALSRLQIRATGLASEAAAALALSPGSAPGTVGVAQETDTAMALVAVQRGAVGLAAETGAALALPVVQLRGVGLSLEIDAAFARSAVQARQAGRADETDTALALVAPAPQGVGLAVETDQALALAPGGGFVAAAARRLAIPAELRHLTVAPENRALRVPAETRIRGVK